MKKHSAVNKIPKAKRPDRPAVSALEWLEDLSGRAARTTVIGSRRLLIENHTGIQDFSESCVRLSTKSGALCVHGEGLSLCDVRKDALIVHGTIRSVELPGEGGVR